MCTFFITNNITNYAGLWLSWADLSSHMLPDIIQTQPAKQQTQQTVFHFWNTDSKWSPWARDKRLGWNKNRTLTLLKYTMSYLITSQLGRDIQNTLLPGAETKAVAKWNTIHGEAQPSHLVFLSVAAVVTKVGMCHDLDLKDNGDIVALTM